MAQTFIHAYQQAMQDVIEQTVSRTAKTIADFLPDIDNGVLNLHHRRL